MFLFYLCFIYFLPTIIRSSSVECPASHFNNDSNAKCPKGVCRKNTICVLDSNFFVGYRCCKSSACVQNEGLYCPEPGFISNTTRIPLIRHRKYPFNPGETVVYSCVKGLINVVADTGAINCLCNGTWSTQSIKCRRLHTGVADFSIPTAVNNPDDDDTDASSFNMTLIIIIVLMMVVVTIGIIGFLVWRKRKYRNEFFFKESDPGQDCEVFPSMPSNLLKDAVPVEKFAMYVAVRHQSNERLFDEEFKEFQNYTHENLTGYASNTGENKLKNRYTNIIAYDHSRVVLRTNGRIGTSDYINANYVASYQHPKAYIACQGPLPTTFNEFWKMVWENNVATIVMITNLVEKGKPKCDQYWPNEGKEQYKNISVILKSTETFASYTVRSFSIKNTKLRNGRGSERKILQFHFTEWPDHGTPEYLLPVLTFIRRSSAANSTTHTDPIVVHCSAGVGRTGTYIVIHSMMQMLQSHSQINIKDFLKFIRLQRNHLVQTEDQYVFVHDAMLEYILSGITECPAEKLAAYYHDLTLTSNGTSGAEEGEVGRAVCRSALEKQFMKVVYTHIDHLDYNIANRTVNESRNRPGAVLPVFRSRVPLCSYNRGEGSDYINASFMQGYRSSSEFIISQLPLSNTKKDFWQLVWDYNCLYFVTILDKQFNPETERYWPKPNTSLNCPSFKVTAVEAQSSKTVGDSDCVLTVKEYMLEATKDDYLLEVKQFEISNWNTEHPSANQLAVLKEIYEFTQLKATVTVIQDRFGSTSAAQFACWHLIHSQLKNEPVVDIYQVAVMACQMRPRVFTSPSHLKFLYEAALLDHKEMNLDSLDLSMDDASVKFNAKAHSSSSVSETAALLTVQETNNIDVDSEHVSA